MFHVILDRFSDMHMNKLHDNKCSSLDHIYSQYKLKLFSPTCSMVVSRIFKTSNCFAQGIYRRHSLRNPQYEITSLKSGDPDGHGLRH